MTSSVPLQNKEMFAHLPTDYNKDTSAVLPLFWVT